MTHEQIEAFGPSRTTVVRDGTYSDRASIRQHHRCGGGLMTAVECQERVERHPIADSDGVLIDALAAHALQVGTLDFPIDADDVGYGEVIDDVRVRPADAGNHTGEWYDLRHVVRVRYGVMGRRARCNQDRQRQTDQNSTSHTDERSTRLLPICTGGSMPLAPHLDPLIHPRAAFGQQ